MDSLAILVQTAEEEIALGKKSEDNNPLFVKVAELYKGLGDKDRTYLTYFCTFDKQRFKYPDYDRFSAEALGVHISEIELLKNDVNLQRRILSLRSLISTIYGTMVVREGAMFKQHRLNILNESVEGLQDIIEARRKIVRKDKEFLLQIQQHTLNLLAGRDPSELNKAEMQEFMKLKMQFEETAKKCAPGAESGLLSYDGTLDKDLITSMKDLLLQISRELGDIVTKTQVSGEISAKIYSQEASDLI